MLCNPGFVECDGNPLAHAVMRGYIGLDGGSTSSKAVLIDENGDILCKQYMLSKGNPIADTKELLTLLKNDIAQQGCTLDVLGFGGPGFDLNRLV